MNWINKAADAIWDRISGAMDGTFNGVARDDFPPIIAKHTPVIDAEKVSKGIMSLVGEWVNYGFRESDSPEVEPDHTLEALWPKLKALTNELITDSIDLNIEWIDNDAEWGIFQLGLLELRNPEEWDWNLYVYGKQRKSGRVATKEDAIKACEKALKRIVTGVKE